MSRINVHCAELNFRSNNTWFLSFEGGRKVLPVLFCIVRKLNNGASQRTPNNFIDHHHISASHFCRLHPRAIGDQGWLGQGAKQIQIGWDQKAGKGQDLFGHLWNGGLFQATQRRLTENVLLSKSTVEKLWANKSVLKMKNRIRQNLWNRTGILMLKKTKNWLTCCCWSPRPRCRCLLRMPRTAASTWEWTLAPSARCNTGWTWKSTCPSSSREPPFCQIKAVLLFSLEFWYTLTTSVRLFFYFDLFEIQFQFSTRFELNFNFNGQQLTLCWETQSFVYWVTQRLSGYIGTG